MLTLSYVKFLSFFGCLFLDNFRVRSKGLCSPADIIQLADAIHQLVLQQISRFRQLFGCFFEWRVTEMFRHFLLLYQLVLTVLTLYDFMLPYVTWTLHVIYLAWLYHHVHCGLKIQIILWAKNTSVVTDEPHHSPLQVIEVM